MVYVPLAVKVTAGTRLGLVVAYSVFIPTTVTDENDAAFETEDPAVGMLHV
jgi:uncharacterized membrane protein